MHECATCHREFSTKGTLTRHEQSHQKTRQYICTQCNVTFYRRDLLTRHMRMHGDTEVNGVVGRDRLRSRTACDACRHARTKCDSQCPCGRCQKRGLSCSFTPTLGRVSTDRDVEAQSSFGRYYAMATDTLHDSGLNSADALGTPQQPDHTGNLNPQLMSMDMALDTPETALGFDAFSPNTIAWPWLHEDIFLQTGFNLDWYDLPNSFTEVNGAAADTWTPPSQQPQSMSDVAELGNNHRAANFLTASHPGHSEQQAVDSTPCGESREALVEMLVENASKWREQTSDYTSAQKKLSVYHAELALSATQLQAVFGLESHAESLDPSDHCLHYFVKLYLEHFWPLWPLFPKYQWKDRSFHPLLYLTMASIGAMYGGKRAGAFGALLHESLRAALLRPFFDYDNSDRELLPLGQARSLTQAAALYFGQKRAFSYAQHIGALLVAQGRKMNIFSRQTPMAAAEHGHRSDAHLLNSWLRKESSKRLAFAILRLEMYTSSLHSTRPLISAEEMDIELPCSRFLWYSEFKSSQSFISAIQQEDSMRTSRPLFSDLVRILHDPEEKLPHIDMLDQELMMNAMQEYVWRACAARDSLERMIPTTPVFQLDLDNGIDEVGCVAGIRQHIATPKNSFTDAHLVRHIRAMSSIRRKDTVVATALRKWHESCLTSEVPSAVADRSSLLSCLLMYHMNFLQLHAPVELIHIICHLPLSTHMTTHEALSKVRLWSTSKRSPVAVQHAISIFKLLKHEAHKELSARAHFNFLTMIGLYHSAALLWVYAGVAGHGIVDEDAVMSVTNLELDCIDHRISISSTTLPSLMEAFVTLFHEINPAWAPRSSFCAAVQRLSQLNFPKD